MKQGSSGPHAGAFTVMELLVAVGIVAILAGLLVAVAKPFIDRASSAACTSNLRQIGAGLAAYAAENDGNLPYSDKTVPLGDWTSNVIYRADIQDWDRLGRIYGYLKSKLVFYCRSVSVYGDHHTVSWDPVPAQGIWGSYCERGHNQSYMQVETIKFASWASRGVVSCFFMNSPNFAPSQNPKVSYHNGIFPVLYGDGSVQMCKMPKVIDVEGKQPIWETTSLQFQIWDSFDQQRRTGEAD